jgi:hypothetical protein
MKLSRLLLVLALIIIISCCTVLAAPTLLSTGAGKSFLLNKINSNIPGMISIKNLKLAWFSGQHVEGFAVSDLEGNQVLGAERLTTEATLLSMILGNLHFSSTEVSGLRAEIIVDEDGTTNLQTALTTAQQSPDRQPDSSSKNIIMPVAITGDLSLTDIKVSITAPDIEPLLIEDISSRLTIVSPQEPIQFTLTARASQGTMSGDISLRGSVKGFDATGTLRPDQAGADIKLKLASLPTNGLDLLLNMDGLLLESLGNQLDMNVDVRVNKGRGEIALALKSPRLKADISAVAADNYLNLTKPATVNGLLTSGLLGILTRKSETKLALAADVPVILEITELNAPLAGFSPETTTIKAKLAIADGSIRSKGPINGLGWRNVSARIAAPNLSSDIKIGIDSAVEQQGRKGGMHVDGSLSNLFDKEGRLQPDKIDADIVIDLITMPVVILDGILGQQGLLLTALGPHIDMNASCKSVGTENLEAAVSISTEKLTATLPISIGKRVALKNTAEISYLLSPELAERYLPKDGLIAGLKKPAKLQIAVSSLDAPPSLSFSDTTLQARGEIAALSLASGKPLGSVDITGFSLDLLANGKENRVTVNASGKAGAGDEEKPGNFRVDASVTGFLQKDTVTMDQAAVNGSISLAGLPTALAEAMAGTDGLITALTGPTMTVDIKADLHDVASPKGTIAVHAKAARMKAQANIGLAEKITLREPAYLSLNLTPEGFAKLLALKKESKSRKEGSSYGLLKDTTIEARMKNLSMPLPAKDKKADLGQLAVELEVLTKQFMLSDEKKKQAAGFEFLQANLTSSGLARDLEFTVHGNTDAKGNVKVSGVLAGLFDNTGNFNPAGAAADIKVDVNELPVSLLDILADTNTMLTSVLGDRMKITGTAKVDLAKKNGPFNLVTASPLSSAKLDAAMVDGLLQLKEPATAELEVTPALAKYTLAKMNPLLAHAVSADRPVTFTVRKENFEIPVDPYDVKRIEVGEAKAEFGTVILENSGVLQALLALLKTGSGNRLTATTTPVLAQVKNGIATYERTDIILDNKISVATWGNIDLVQDQVNMVLGLPAETLDKVLNIDGLSADYVMQIPVEGSTSSPKVNWQKAGRDIALLLSSSRLDQNLPGAGSLLQGSSPAAPTAPRQPVSEKQKEQPQPQQVPQKEQPPDPMQQLLNKGLERLFK